MDKTQEFQWRQITREDLPHLYDVASHMSSVKPSGYFEESFARQEQGERQCFLMYYRGDLAGYGMISWMPKYGFYRAHNIPEIQDLNVIPEFRMRGLATAFIDMCEDLARDKGYTQMGIGVGLTPSYGAAQRLYVRLGYVPDGFGVTYDRRIVRHGEFRPIDDEMSLMMVKAL